MDACDGGPRGGYGPRVTTDLTASWPAQSTDELRAGLQGLLRDVVRAGGAVGWLEPPGRADTDSWLDRLTAQQQAGDAGLVVIGDPVAPLAMGTWRRVDRQVHRHVAEIAKVMSHPRARGRGLGRRVTTELLAALPAAGIEIVTLATRGNNHAAMALYTSLGFREYGRIPDGIMVGDDRYDDVRFVLSIE
ncbi:GCN5-related N-acetyltransferase [Nocardioides sp. JS614]|nr:GCN5-related N-acetyltransferase [Nocardioides sp. JS614]